jgi:virulence factor Mce-like protein
VVEVKLFNRLNPVLVAVAVVALVAALLVAFWPGSSQKTIVADFPRTVSLYEGSEVKILGVPVGKVDSVVPEGTKVRVELHYDSKYKVPENAKAAVISPSVVGDRFVQLTPAYKGGPTMADDTHLGVDRTATPLELDEIFRSINDLDIALGPNGANKSDASGTGPLTRLLDSTARNFGGQGVQFNQTLKNLGAFSKTLSDNKEELFGTLSQVEDFTSTLKKNDQTVRSFNDSLSQGADLLAGERQDLAAVLRNLSTAMTQVRSFVAENRSSLTRNISGLNRISKTLVKQRDALDKTLQYAPGALNNLYLAGNVKQGTLDTRANLGETVSELQDDPAATLCTLVGQAAKADGVCANFTKIFGAARNRAPVGPVARDKAHVVEPIDPTMAGLLGPSR